MHLIRPAAFALMACVAFCSAAKGGPAGVFPAVLGCGSSQDDGKGKLEYPCFKGEGNSGIHFTFNADSFGFGSDFDRGGKGNDPAFIFPLWPDNGFRGFSYGGKGWKKGPDCSRYFGSPKDTWWDWDPGKPPKCDPHGPSWGNGKPGSYTPEPASTVVLGIGVTALLAGAWRRKLRRNG